MNWRSWGNADADGYAAWAPYYAAEAHNPLMRVEQKAMLDLMPPVDGRTVLDAGCGTGRYARILAAAGTRHVAGVDRSSAMLAHARGSGAALVRADMRALPAGDETCDVIVSGLMLPDIADLGIVTREWRRVLRPGGVLVYSTLHPIGAELGWTRTFETPHGTHTLPAAWHSIDEHRRACSAAGLIVDALVEPRLNPGDRGPMGTPRTGVPVALVVRARRPGSR